MADPTENQILKAEEQLPQAMLHSDVAALDRLLSPDLLFTNHLGQVLEKEDDLGAHRSGIVEVHELILSERQLQLHGSLAVVSVRAQLSGSYGGNPANGDFRFTRVWACSSEGAWQVVAGHSCLVV